MTALKVSLQHISPLPEKRRTLSAPADPTPNPHAGVQMQIPGVTSLHLDEDAVRVGLGINLISMGRIFELLEHIARTDTPAFVLDGDICRRVIMSLEEVVAVEVGGEVGSDEL